MMKKTFAAMSLSMAMLLSACAGSAPATGNEDEKEVEQFNVISDAFDKNEFETGFTTMFEDTLKAYENKIEIDADRSGKLVEVQDNNGEKELVRVTADDDTDTVTFQQNDKLYFITDTAEDEMALTRYGDDGGKSVTLKESGEDDQYTISSIGGGTKDVKSFDERQQQILADLFNTNADIPFNPVDNSDLYVFTTELTGTGVVVNVDLKDIEDFNKQAKDISGYLDKDGVTFDDINIKKNAFTININNEGVIQSITNIVEIDYTLNGTKKSEAYDVNTDIYTYDYDTFNTDEIDKIFDGIDDGTLKEGSTVSLAQKDTNEKDD